MTSTEFSSAHHFTWPVMTATREWLLPSKSTQAWVDRLMSDRTAMYRRVARAVAGAEPQPLDEIERTRLCESFEQAMSSGDFLPNSPTLVNAGTEAGVLSACFVLPFNADTEQSEKTLELTRALHHAGAGTGFSFSCIGDTNSAQVIEGLIRGVDKMSRSIMSQGCRSGANMGVLRVDHPAIQTFVALKRDAPTLCRFNFSIGVTDHFMQCVTKGLHFALRDPLKGKPVTRVWAKDLFHEIAEAAWASGDPGMIFLDEVQRANPVPALGALECTNPCGEAPLLPYESCNLGSINLANMLYMPQGGGTSLDWAHLERTTRLAVRFLDDVIDAASWPDERLAAAAIRTRKIGLGVMGFADLLVHLRIPYASSRAEQVATQLMSFINHVAHSASEELAEQRGCFPAWPQSVYGQKQVRIRNAVCTSIAPTGTISRLAGVNPGIEPFFELLSGSTQTGVSSPQVCNALHRYAVDTHRDVKELSDYLIANGSLAGAPGVHESDARLFRTATEIPADGHLVIQSAFQQHTDQAVAKTVNLPTRATIEQVQHIFSEAWAMGLKGVTVFRWGCGDAQPYGRSC